MSASHQFSMPVSPGWADTTNSPPNPWDPLPFTPVLSKPFVCRLPQQDSHGAPMNLVELDIANTLPTSLRRTPDSEPTSQFLQPSPVGIKSRTKLPVWTPPCLPRPRSPTPKQTIRYVKRSCVDQVVYTKPQTTDTSTETGSSIQLRSAFVPVKPTTGSCVTGVGSSALTMSTGICEPMSSCGPAGSICGPAGNTCGPAGSPCGPTVGTCGPGGGTCGQAVGTCGPAGGTCGPAGGTCGPAVNGPSVNTCGPTVNTCGPSTCGRCNAHQCSAPFGNWSEYQKGVWVQSGGVDLYRWRSNPWRSCGQPCGQPCGQSCGQPCEWVQHSQTRIDPLLSKSSHHCGHVHAVSESAKSSRTDSPATMNMHHKHHKCRRQR